MAAVKTPAYQIVYNGRNVTRDLAPFFEEAEYIDRFTGESDELSITVSDPDGRWLSSWYPDKGDTLQLLFGYEGEKLTDTGTLDVDEIEMSGPPTQVKIKALSVGLTDQSKTRKGKAYENTSLKAIGEKIAKSMKAKLFGSIAAIPIKKATQYQETNWAFLVRIFREHGYRIKLTHSGTRIVAERLQTKNEGYELRITPQTVADWAYRDKITEVPAKSKTRYHDPDKKAVTRGDANAGGVAQGKTSAHTLKQHRRPGSPAQAKAQAQADQDRQEIDKTALDFTMEGDQKVSAGTGVIVAEFGRLNGEYIASELRHTISGSGYQMMLQTKRVGN